MTSWRRRRQPPWRCSACVTETRCPACIPIFCRSVDPLRHRVSHALPPHKVKLSSSNAALVSPHVIAKACTCRSPANGCTTVMPCSLQTLEPLGYLHAGFPTSERIIGIGGRRSGISQSRCSAGPSALDAGCNPTGEPGRQSVFGRTIQYANRPCIESYSI